MITRKRFVASQLIETERCLDRSVVSSCEARRWFRCWWWMWIEGGFVAAQLSGLWCLMMDVFSGDDRGFGNGGAVRA